MRNCRGLFQVRGVFGSILACDANGRGSTPLDLTNLQCTRGEIGHHRSLRNSYFQFESERVYHFRQLFRLPDSDRKADDF